MTVTLIRGDAAHLPLPDRSVDLVVTSPPYFALRSYQDTVECDRCRELRAGWGRRDDHARNLREAWPDWDAHVAVEHKPSHYPGQIGSEDTPGEWLDALIGCMREWVRVLKPSGSIWVNLGDKYAAGHGGSSTEGNGVNLNVGHAASNNFRDRPDLPNPPASWGKRDASGRAVVPGTRPKSLLGLPWRFALRCIDELGLILRAEVVWHKTNGLPESVTDRVRRSHETWFHFVVRPRYYAAIDTIREAQMHGLDRTGHRRTPDGKWFDPTDGGDDRFRLTERTLHPLGKLPGSVWSIPSQPLTVPKISPIDGRPLPDHFAAYPCEWPRRLIQGWSPSGICTRCGEGRRPVTEVRYVVQDRLPDRCAASLAINGTGTPGSGQWDMATRSQGRASRNSATTDEVCGCPTVTLPAVSLPPTRPAVVLDPFGGTGTTALVADVLGRHGISVDMSHDYCRLAAWRTTDPGERARAMQVDKPEPVPVGQLGLFEAVT